MIKRLVVLLQKELREHGAVLLLLVVVMTIVWTILMLATVGKARSISYFEAHANFARFFVPMIAMALGHRFVVREYYGRTQRFVEALPMRSLEPLVVKFAIAGLFVVGLSLGSLGANVLVASSHESVDANFVRVLGLRTAAFELAMLSFFFTMGLLGKLRIPLYIFIFTLGAIVIETTELDAQHTPVFDLVGRDFAVSRLMPWSAIAVGFASTGVMFVIGLVVASVREGSVTEALSKRLSARERGLAGIATIAAMIVTSELEASPVPAPYDLHDALRVRAEGIPLVVVHHESAHEAEAKRVRDRIAPALRTLQRGMGYPTLPTTRVVLSRSLDGHTFEPLWLAPGDGVLVRANFIEPDFDLDGVVAAVITEVVDERSGRRSSFAPMRMFRDGIVRHVVRPTRDALPSRPLVLASIATRTHAVTARRLVSADTEREHLGVVVAEGLAETCVHALVARVGEARTFSLARRLFGTRARNDSRETIRALRHPIERRIVVDAGMTLERWASACDETIRRGRVREDVRSVLAGLSPLPLASMRVEGRDGSGRTLRLYIRVPSHGREPARIRVHTRALAPLDEVVDPWVPRVDAFVLEPNEHERSLALRGLVSAGTRHLVAVDVEHSVDGQPVPIRVVSERRVIR